MKIQITNEYIKGFFDGEGSFTIRHYKTPNNAVGGVLVIANTNKTILKGILKHLKKLGIRGTLVQQSRLIGRTIYYVTISDVYSIFLFFKLIGSNRNIMSGKLEILKTESHRLIRTLKVLRDLNKIHNLYSNGSSQKKIAELLNYPGQTTISRILRSDYYHNLVKI